MGLPFYGLRRATCPPPRASRTSPATLMRADPSRQHCDLTLLPAMARTASRAAGPGFLELHRAPVRPRLETVGRREASRGFESLPLRLAPGPGFRQQASLCEISREFERGDAPIPRVQMRELRPSSGKSLKCTIFPSLKVKTFVPLSLEPYSARPALSGDADCDDYSISNDHWFFRSQLGFSPRLLQSHPLFANLLVTGINPAVDAPRLR